MTDEDDAQKSSLKACNIKYNYNMTSSISDIIKNLNKLKKNVDKCKQKIKSNNNDKDISLIVSMMDSFQSDIDQKIKAECKHKYKDTIVTDIENKNKSIRITYCSDCCSLFPYCHSNL